MIEIKNVTKAYSLGGEVFKALDDVSLTIPTGQMIAITGHSGSGKSTLLNMISGLDIPSSGEILVDGKDYQKMNDKELSLFRSEHIGFIFQQFYLEPEYSVYENMVLPLAITKCNAEEIAQKGFDMLKSLDMLEKSSQKVRYLSGGEQQKCCIGRALIKNPEIIFADEPCGNLDSVNGKMVMNILLDLKKQGKTIVLVTHNMSDARMADRMITMKDGKVIKDELLSHH